MVNEVLIRKINTVIQKYRNDSATFSNFWKSLVDSGDFYIIGGAIRSIFTHSTPRDIDIIVKSDMQKIFARLNEGVEINRNYYGGYKIDFDGIIVDLWDFKSHWAFKNGILPADENNLAESCFFDFDSLVYSPTTGFLDIDRYLHSIRSHMIDFTTIPH